MINSIKTCHNVVQNKSISRALLASLCYQFNIIHIKLLNFLTTKFLFLFFFCHILIHFFLSQFCRTYKSQEERPLELTTKPLYVGNKHKFNVHVCVRASDACVSLRKQIRWASDDDIGQWNR